MIITVAMAISMTLMTLIALMNVSMATTSIVLVNMLVVIAGPTRSVPATSHIFIRIIGHSIRILCAIHTMCIVMITLTLMSYCFLIITMIVIATISYFRQVRFLRWLPLV